MNITDRNPPAFSGGENGYLTVKVSTARGAIPLEGATVNIRGNEADISSVIYSLRSDRDGKIPRVSLSTPPAKESASPQASAPYATYNIDVFKDGYTPLFFHNVPVFSGVTSVQPAVMVPISASATHIDEGYRAASGETEENV